MKLGIGPVIEDGFYYDVDIEQPLSSEDLAAIEQEMNAIVKENLPIVRREVSRDEAVNLFADLEEPLKLELIRDLPEEAVISIYDQGEFSDLCRGPHLASTGQIKVFKLMSVAGAYWRGDSNNKMLQRIYGVAFLKKTSSMSICTCWRKPRNGITASSARSWSCSCSPRNHQACRSICPKG